MSALVEFRKQSQNVTWQCVNFVENLWIFNPYLLFGKVTILRVPETGYFKPWSYITVHYIV